MSAQTLTTASVLRVREDSCDVVAAGGERTVGYASAFPTPHVERVAPGNLVALAGELVVWRWYDAVVLGHQPLRLWEPAHGEVTATLRPGRALPPIGSRAYASAGLPGADWWVAGREDADVELAEVKQLYIQYGLWDALG